MADDATHRRNGRMTVMAALAFVGGVSGIALHIDWLTAVGIGAFTVAVLGRFWT